MGAFAKLFIAITTIVCVFKIEFFPFSNYQMYSELFAPNSEYKYNEITIVKNGNEEKFVNRKYGLFHGEQPLVEAYRRNYVRKGKNYSEEFLKDLFSYKNISSSAEAIRINVVSFDWQNYKNSVLQNEKADPNQFIKKTIAAEYRKRED